MANETRPALPRYCGSCGKELLQGADFCAYCGAPVPKLDTQSHPQTTTPPYYITSQAPMPRTEPPLPFVKHFQGVILTPHEEMPKIAERPNLKQPFVLILLVGILAGVAISVFLSKASLIVFPEFGQSLQEIAPTLPSDFDFESFILFTLFTSSLIGPIILWLVNSVILYFLLAIFASTVPSSTRDFKTTTTIVGWASVPQLVGEMLNILYNLILAPEIEFELREFGDMQNIAVPFVSGPIEWISFGVEIGILVWGVLLVYWALKSVVPQEKQPMIISILYIVTGIVVSVILTMFLI